MEIYVLRFSDGKEYVGASKKAKRRIYEHQNAATVKLETASVYDAWRRLGPPKMRVVETVSAEDAAEREAHWMRELGTLFPGGYNRNTAAKPLSFRRVPDRVALVHLETRGRRIAAARRREWAERSPEEKARILAPAQQARRRK